MKRLFFLPPEIVWAILFLLIYGFFHFSTGYQILLSFVCGGVFFIFRRSFVPYRDTLKNNGEIYLSPVFGIVQKIRFGVQVPEIGETAHEIRIAISWWHEKGLYLPTSGEVSYLKASRGERVGKHSPSEAFYGTIDELSHTDFTLTSKNQARSLLRFIDCKYGIRPTIWLKSGDRGRGAACFGYYPFGGTLIVYVPANSDILVFEGEKIIPGQTVIAAIKEIK